MLKPYQVAAYQSKYRDRNNKDYKCNSKLYWFLIHDDLLLHSEQSMCRLIGKLFTLYPISRTELQKNELLGFIISLDAYNGR